MEEGGLSGACASLAVATSATRWRRVSAGSATKTGREPLMARENCARMQCLLLSCYCRTTAALLRLYCRYHLWHFLKKPAGEGGDSSGRGGASLPNAANPIKYSGSCAAVERQLSGSRAAVVRQSKGSCPPLTCSCTGSTNRGISGSDANAMQCERLLKRHLRENEQACADVPRDC